jgi:signal peptidase
MPNGSGRIIAAFLLLPVVVAAYILIKKRIALSINSKQVLFLISVIGLLYVVFYYVSGLYFGFIKTGYGSKFDIITRFIVPIGIIIVATEIIRHILCAQKDRIASVFAYLICLVAEIVACSTIPGITNFSIFMEVVGVTLMPGIISNFVFNYLSVRYGFLPNIVYRAFTVWIFYLIPYGSAISYSLLAFFNIILAIAVYLFIDSLFEKKRRYALGNMSPAARAMSRLLTAVVIILMTGSLMLVSNQFYYGAYVIATESMTGEINKGDVAIYESYEGQFIREGQVIVFEKGKSKIIHRVVEIEIINGNKRYYTKGDANENMDAGYITDADIVGLVNVKLPYFGYPTLWLRSLFEH